MPTLTQTITESITLDHGDVNSTKTITIDNITDIYKRVVTITANQDVIIASFDANVADTAVANLDVENVKYIRVTNLDSDAVEINIAVDQDNNGSADGNFSYSLTQNQSMILFNASNCVNVHDASGSVEAVAGDIFSITANPLGNAGKVEIFAASTVVS